MNIKNGNNQVILVSAPFLFMGPSWNMGIGTWAWQFQLIFLLTHFTGRCILSKLQEFKFRREYKKIIYKWELLWRLTGLVKDWLMEARASKHQRGQKKYPTCVRDIDPTCQHSHHGGPECLLTLDWWPLVHKHHWHQGHFKGMEKQAQIKTKMYA